MQAPFLPYCKDRERLMIYLKYSRMKSLIEGGHDGYMQATYGTRYIS